MNESSAHSYSYSLSNSVHSLGSRKSITNTSINNWRSSQQQMHMNHRNTRNNNLYGNNNTGSDSHHNTRTFDSMMISDSLHRHRMQKQKPQKNKYRRNSGSSYNKKPNSNSNYANRISTSAAIVIADSVVALATPPISDDDDCDDVQEFYGDEDEECDSTSTSSILSFATSTSLNSSINSMYGSSMHNTNHKSSSNNNDTSNPRTNGASTNTTTVKFLNAGAIQGMPKMPERTKDCETTFGFKRNIQRSLSDDGSWLSSSQQTGDSSTFGGPKKITTKIKKRGAILRSRSSCDPVGRWAAMITTKGFGGGGGDSNNANSALHQYLIPPRRVASSSEHGTASYSSSDAEDLSEEDVLEDGFMTSSPTISTKAFVSGSLKILFAPSTSSPDLIPSDSLREMPDRAFQGDNTNNIVSNKNIIGDRNETNNHLDSATNHSLCTTNHSIRTASA